MTTAAFDPDRSTGTFIFAHGVRLTPVINAVLGALAFNIVDVDGTSQHLAFSGETSATWGSVLDNLAARGRELGISTSVMTRDSAQLFDLLGAFATHVGAKPADVKALLGHSLPALDALATVEDLVGLARLLDDGHGLQGYRIEEFSVNVTDGKCAYWNPFDRNFASQAAAEEAAEQFLREDEECNVAVIGKVVIHDNEFQTDDTQDSLATIHREDLDDSPAAPAP